MTATLQLIDSISCCASINYKPQSNCSIFRVHAPWTRARSCAVPGWLRTTWQGCTEDRPASPGRPCVLSWPPLPWEQCGSSSSNPWLLTEKSCPVAKEFKRGETAARWLWIGIACWKRYQWKKLRLYAAKKSSGGFVKDLPKNLRISGI